METPPIIAIPRDLADRFPDLVAALQPRTFRGEVNVVADALLPDDLRHVRHAIDYRYLSGDDGRRSGLMLPDEEGNAVEFLRPDVKGRTDTTIWTPSVDDEPEWLFRAVHRTVWHFGITCPPLDRVIFGAYGVGDHFAWHRDDMLPATARRDTAVVIGLNDDYEGGLLELPEAGLSLKVGTGMGVAFPASALHRVTPVTRGVRRVLLTFTLRG